MSYKNEGYKNEKYNYPCLMKVGDEIRPAPELLTVQEAIQFLRLDVDGPEHPKMTLQYYRQQGLLRPTKVGKKLRYRLSELLRFLEEQTKRTNEDIS